MATGTVKEPKKRPRTLKREWLPIRQKALPKYTGPYDVGSMEIEVPVEKPHVYCHDPFLQLETVLMTVFYPAALESRISEHPAGFTKWPHDTWLPKPRMKMAQGFGYYGGIGDWAIPLFGSTCMLTKIAAYRNAPVATHWPASKITHKAGPQNKTSEDDKPYGATEGPVFPIMIFSHGLGGFRTTYSSLSGELASYGFIIVALEHRDGTAVRTFVNHSDHKEEASIPEREKSENGNHPRRKTYKNNYDVVEYVFPKENPQDTSPNNEKSVVRDVRDAQTDLRCAEFEEAYKVMKTIVEGRGEEIARKNRRAKPNIGSRSSGLEDIDWSAWKDRAHIKHVTVGGHSFGATTVVEILRNLDRFEWVSQGILYDIWGGGVKGQLSSSPGDVVSNDVESKRPPISGPLLAINSEAFTYWKSNFNLVESLVEETRSEPNPCPAWLLTIRGTIHITQSDLCLLFPHANSAILKMTAEPYRALDLNIVATIEFMRAVSPFGDVFSSAPNEKLLEQPITEISKEELHPPDQDHIATSLDIPNEARYRISPKLFFKGLRVKKRGGNVGLVGFGNSEVEIWMHAKPKEEELGTYRAKLSDGR